MVWSLLCWQNKSKQNNKNGDVANKPLKIFHFRGKHCCPLTSSCSPLASVAVRTLNTGTRLVWGPADLLCCSPALEARTNLFTNCPRCFSIKSSVHVAGNEEGETVWVNLNYHAEESQVKMWVPWEQGSPLLCFPLNLRYRSNLTWWIFRERKHEYCFTNPYYEGHYEHHFCISVLPTRLEAPWARGTNLLFHVLTSNGCCNYQVRAY